jgi:hypothetical protein
MRLSDFLLRLMTGIFALMLLVALPISTDAATPQRPAPAKRAQVPPPASRAPATSSPFSAPEPADNVLTIKLSDDGKTIFLAGGLATGSYRKFARVLGTAPNAKTVHLGSPGGIVLEGFLIAALVREKKLNTYAEVQCASSCTQILVSGIDRAVSPRALIGFHKSGPVEADDSDSAAEAAKPKPSAAPAPTPAKADQDLLFKLPFQRAGVSKDFVERAFSTPHEDIWNPKLEEMLAAGFLTRRSDGGEHIAPAGIGLSLAETESALLADPVWQVLKAKRAPLFAGATDTVMRMSQTGVAKDEALATAFGLMLAGLATDISRAPEPLLEGFFNLTRDQMSTSPEGMFPSCARANAKAASKREALPPELIARERALIEQLLSARLQPKLMKPEKAFIALQAAFGNRAPAVPPGMSKDEAECADSKDTFTRLAALDLPTRNKAFRALLSFAATISN